MIDLGHLKGQTIAVFGLGLSGRATVTALTRAGVEVWAWDDQESRRDQLKTVGTEAVNLYEADWQKVDALILSPGIPHSFPTPHPIAEKAQAANCSIIGDIELLAQAQRQSRFIGITGTNGKSTTTALIGHILKESGIPCAIGGNLGIPALDLDSLGPEGIYVLEMSSYQLELTPSLTFDIAVLLNISPDHLERHGGMEGYIQAKRRIFKGQSGDQTAIIAVDDQISQDIFDDLASREDRRVVPVSYDLPHPRGAYVLDGILFDSQGGAAAKIYDLGGLTNLLGKHNWQNMAAAYAACYAIGLEQEQIISGLKSFPGLPHRQEQVAIIDGVSFINDSKATNASATAKALACYSHIFWIAGGRSKAGGLDGLEGLFPNIAEVFLIGEAANAFARRLDGQLNFQICGDLATAIRAAAKSAHEFSLTRPITEKADAPVVLLSPACASFDQFENFEKRGDAFRQAVRELDTPMPGQNHSTAVAGGAS
ncbi:MAG: UDP-N-acetylmuramoyl-L-alanine--D-glutamate ligase [Pseudomonadota bacterium]